MTRVLAAALILAAGCVGEDASRSVGDADRVRDLLTVGAAHAEIEQWAEAAQSFAEALELAPDEPAARFGLALAALRGGDAAAARERLAEIRAEGDSPALPADFLARVAFLEGKIAYELGDFTGEAAAYRRAAELAPEEAAYPYALAQVLPRLEEAAGEGRLSMLARAYALWPDNSRLAAEYALLALGEGDEATRRQGLAALERVVKAARSAPVDAQLEAGRAELEAGSARVPAGFRRALNLLRPGKRFQVDSSALEARLEPRAESAPLAPTPSSPRSPPPAVGLAPAELLTSPALAEGEGVVDLVPFSHAAATGETRAGLALLSSGALFVSDGPGGGFARLGEVAGAGASLVAGELDADGWTELAVVDASGARIWSRGAEGAWSERPAGPAWELGAAPIQALPLDFEHDGDLDLLLVDRAGALHLVTHRGESGWGAAEPAPLPLGGVARRLLAADLDGDDDQDLVVAGASGLLVLRNWRQGEFLAGGGVELPAEATALEAVDYDLDGDFDLAAVAGGHLTLVRNRGAAGLEPDGEALGEVAAESLSATALAVADFDLSGDPDLLVATGDEVLLLANDGGGRFAAAARAPAPALAGVVALDLDGDRDPDLAGWRSAELASFAAAGAERQAWLALRLRGLPGKVPLDGRGARVLVAAGGRSQWLAPTRPLVVAGLGESTPALVRVTWPNGISEFLFEPEPGREHVIEQVLRIEGSCPFLYASDGAGRRFVTDILGLAPLGMLAAPGRYVPADPEEYLRLPDWVRERDGAVELIVTEELREVAYLDQMRLVAVDAPAGIEVHNTERWVVPPVAGLELRLLDAVRPPVSVRDHRGREVLEVVAARDDRYLTNHDRKRLYQGAVEPHALTVELPPSVARSARPALVLVGWLHWGNTSMNVARAQDPGGAPLFPYLEVPDGAGGWRRTEVAVGLPAGKTKPVVVDLAGAVDPADPRIRITTDFEVYWDRIAVGAARDPRSVGHSVSVLQPSSAELRFGGFSRWYRPAANGPYLFDYGDRRPYPWRPRADGGERRLAWQEHEGRYTRFGPVTDLLAAIDDRLVVFGSGEELTARFDTATLPPPPAGWRRTFFAHFEGWEKDGDPNVACASTVEPLPRRGLPYPCPVAVREPGAGPADARRERWVSRDRLLRRAAADLAPAGATLSAASSPSPYDRREVDMSKLPSAAAAGARRHRTPPPALVAVLAALTGCAAPEPERDPAAEVAALAEEAWRHALERSPYLQVRQGRLLRELPDLTPERAAEDVARARALLERIDAVAVDELAHEDALTLAILRWDAGLEITGAPYYWHASPVSPYVAGFGINFLHQAMASHPFDDPEAHAENYLTLVGEYAVQLEQMRVKLEGQAKRGIRVPRPALPGVIGLFQAFREGVRGVVTVAPERLDAFDDAQRARLRAAVAAAIGDRVEPAYDALLAVLESEEYRDRAPEAVGLGHYPEGEAYYRHLVRLHTTLDVTPEELHELGRRRVSELLAEMAAIRDEVGFEGSQAEFHERLRSDPRFLARTPADVEARFADYIARIEARVPELFRRRPRAPYGVRRLDPAAEGAMTFGYYQQPTPAEPTGLYRYNGSRLEERSLVFAGPLIYHELVPGHHFHIALQNENEALPLYRRESLAAGAFNEGWGNYAALLAREAGCLDDPYDRYGWAIFDMFISTRLVVDTGMNLLGWSLEESRQFMRDHTFQSETEIATESLRYSTDLHGQALAYKAGLEKLLELRARARELAGEEFDIRDFHDAVLGSGAMPLAVLEGHVEWVFGEGSPRPGG